MATPQPPHDADSSQPPTTLSNSSSSGWGVLFKGMAMGAADVVPGVSGGTLALLLGVYEPLISSLQAISRPTTWQALWGRRWAELGQRLQLGFLLRLGTGIMLAILALAQLLSWLLEHHAVLLWSFFFGLIAASVLTVSRRVRHWQTPQLAAFAGASLVAFVLLGLNPITTPETLPFVFLSGAVAICAMILPGISGAFILLILGKYAFMVDAISSMNLVVIIIFMAGAAAGLISFARLLGWLLLRHHDMTIALLCGFMLGSLRRVYPWQSIHTGVHVNTTPPLWQAGGVNLEPLAALLLAVLGFVLVLVLERQNQTTRPPLALSILLRQYVANLRAKRYKAKGDPKR